MKESKAHERSNNISWQEIDGDTVEYILLSICCSAVSVECPCLNALRNVSYNLFSDINLFNCIATIRSRIFLRNEIIACLKEVGKLP